MAFFNIYWTFSVCCGKIILKFLSLETNVKIIARIYTEFDEKFGIPRQSGLVSETVGKIVFEPEYRNPEALRGIDGYSHLWLIWQFSEAVRDTWSPTVRPPRLGGNKRMGVFATRSPYRPNPIGLSSVRLIEVKHTETEGTVLLVGGADLLSGTPIYDVKPYLAFTDSHPEAIGGFTDTLEDFLLEVSVPSEIKQKLSKDLYECLIDCLKNDPRPSYIDTPSRVFGFLFDKYEVKFTVEGKNLTVISLCEI